MRDRGETGRGERRAPRTGARPAQGDSGRGSDRPAPLAHLQRLAGNRAVQRLVTAAQPPLTVQRFGSHEHLRIGDQGASRAGAEKITLAPDYQLTYGEMIAMAGDYFGSLDQMRQLAAIAGQGAGTREELEYVRVAKVRREGGRFSDGAKQAADRRYVELALDNRSHFVNPDRGDPGRSSGVHRELQLRWNGLFPRFVDALVVPHAGAGYRHYHLQALFEAYVAGFEGHGMEESLAPEAFGCHYLTDAFSGGHLRTERTSISGHWNPKVPMFTANLKGFMAQALALRIGDAETWISREMAYHGVGWKAGTLEQVSAVLDAKGALTFGDVVAGAIHDYDSARGVLADVDGERVNLMGDNKLGGRTEELVVEAVNLSHNDVTRAWQVGRRRGGLEEVLSESTTGGFVGAERMLPKVVADSELRPEQQSVKWDFPSADALLDHGPFQAALAEFGRRKATELAEIEGDLPPVAKPHFGPAIVDPFRNEPVDTLRRVVHWTPDTGGGLFGHNQDDNALDYYHEADRAGAVATLTVQQRNRLIRDLLDGYTADDEANAVFHLLTANSAHSDDVIAAVGWDRLHDELGGRFSSRFPESSHR